MTEDELKTLETLAARAKAENKQVTLEHTTFSWLVAEVRRLRACKAFTFKDGQQVPCDLLTGHNGTHVFAVDTYTPEGVRAVMAACGVPLGAKVHEDLYRRLSHDHDDTCWRCGYCINSQQGKCTKCGSKQ